MQTRPRLYPPAGDRVAISYQAGPLREISSCVFTPSATTSQLRLGTSHISRTTLRDMATDEPPTQEGSAAAGTSVIPDPVSGVVPGQHWLQTAQNIPQDDDRDSALGDDDNDTSTASITSSILHYRTIQGRTYHSERGNAKYWGSNDEAQNESMDINHHSLLLALDNKLYLAPLSKDIQKVIDIGTGTGIWAIDFADEFPNTEVIGTDISPIQPSWVPPNLKFEIEDCTQQWTFPSDSFDFVHIRWLNGSIDDWAKLFREAYRCCKPGGYLESFEGAPYLESDDGTVKDTEALGQWGKLFVEAGRRFGRSFTTVPDGIQRKAIEEAGFVEVDEKNIKTPIGGWPKDSLLKSIGRYAQIALTEDVEGYVLLMAKEVGWTEQETLLYAAQVRREIRSGKHHAYYRQKIVWGRKPEAS
ncbi:Methyltransferase domain-containing protein [Pleurostoma richardsiae]|uniref:Methyltransferase domain-containing protein n=1 Tax=Pleurostoma richardsiae TaxID=41990 RepID=A0AA38S048_9PEZI|nr:Methyltransferase domain-containing protein [Pleurostoma richardsiae]